MNAPFIPHNKREHRLDVVRGLALLTIFIDHVPGNVYENATLRNFGFSDAAEAFVLMSGIAVGLAYARAFREAGLVGGVARVWRRAATLYVTHIVVSVFAMGIIAAGLVHLGTYEIIDRVNLTALVDHPYQTLVGIPLLGHQLGYFNILPLYAVLLFVSPAYILVGLRSKVAMVIMAGAIWFAAGMFRLNLPNYPSPGGWFFDPLAWQFVYAIGIAGGLSAVEGRKLLACNRWLYWTCAGFLAFACLWVVADYGRWPGQAHLPFFLGGFDKTFLALPRFLHALALAYVVTNTAWISWLLAARVFRPVMLMGRNGLAVFATGSLLAIALQVLRARYQTGLLGDTLLLGSCILVQYAVAHLAMAGRASAREREKAPRTSAKADPGQTARVPLRDAA